MKIVCTSEELQLTGKYSGDLNVVLYGRTNKQDSGSVGAAARHIIQREKIQPAARAWDLLSIALAVVTSDISVKRDASADGWTRQIDLSVAVSDPGFWNAQQDVLVRALRFLTNDIWTLSFLQGDAPPAVPESSVRKPDQDCVSLLSGGLDSLVGAIDLTEKVGIRPYLVSQVSKGDSSTQRSFASRIGQGLPLLQLNHNAKCPGQRERSERARSIVFFAYGVLMATALGRYHEGENVTLYICENGFISINPPLTGARLGSLSTRTTHPFYLWLFQEALDAAGLRVQLENPYQFKTKGEMLKECADQALLSKVAYKSTSCGRYARNAYTHCGRCLPCLIRRSAFLAWGKKDGTVYVYKDLSKNDKNHLRHDDVRSAAMAIATVREEGVSHWAGPALSSALLGDVGPYRAVVERGLNELDSFLSCAGVM